MTFSCRNLLLYPNGNNAPDQVSLYIENAEAKEETEASDICAQVMLCIVHPEDPTKFIRQGRKHTYQTIIGAIDTFSAFQHRFSKYEPDRGYTQYLDLKSLTTGNEKYGPFVTDDALKIMAIIRLVEDPTGVLWHNFIK